MDFADAAARIVGQIEQAGFAVSVYHMRQYVELYAVHLSGDHISHVARCEGGGEAETYQAAMLLSQMVGIAIKE